MRWLVAHSHGNDHLVFTVDRQLAVVALQIGAAWLHEMVVESMKLRWLLGISVRSAIRDRPRHGIGCNMRQIRRLHTGLFCGLDCFLPCGSGLNKSEDSVRHNFIKAAKTYGHSLIMESDSNAYVMKKLKT